jgi:hypothetical protein
MYTGRSITTVRRMISGVGGGARVGSGAATSTALTCSSAAVTASPHTGSLAFDHSGQASAPQTTGVAAMARTMMAIFAPRYLIRMLASFL